MFQIRIFVFNIWKDKVTFSIHDIVKHRGALASLTAKKFILISDISFGVKLYQDFQSATCGLSLWVLVMNDKSELRASQDVAIGGKHSQSIKIRF